MSPNLGFESGRVPRLVDAYLTAMDVVVRCGYAWEVDWQANLCFSQVQESDFLRESAWTVLSSGFRESIVRSLFSRFSEAFLGWRSADCIDRNRMRCKRAALNLFRNERKVDAILGIACLVADRGFESVRHRIQEEGLPFLRTLPYIGPTTAFHLAKNLGLPFVKPDRHMLRIAAAAGFSSPLEACEAISERVGEPIQVIDVVLWRYATLRPDYLSHFRFPEASLSSAEYQT